MFGDRARQAVRQVGAPTDHVEAVRGRKPESFETIARRYIDNPSLIRPRLKRAESWMRWPPFGCDSTNSATKIFDL